MDFSLSSKDLRCHKVSVDFDPSGGGIVDSAIACNAGSLGSIPAVAKNQ